MKIPVNEKRLITITEAEEYYSIGKKTLRALAATHPDLVIFYGNRWLFFREEMEHYLKYYGLDENGTKNLKNQQNSDWDSDYADFRYDDFKFGG